MATLRQIKEKQTSIKTINKITKAMQLVSSAKSQKAIKDLRNFMEYIIKVERVMYELEKGSIREEKEYKGTYWILVMSDLGLAGGYNSSLIKELTKQKKDGDKFLIIGNKGISYSKKHRDDSEWFTLGDIIEENNLSEIATRIQTNHYDEDLEIKVIYTEYKSQIDFYPVSKTILPIKVEEFNSEEDESMFAEVDFEPNREELMKELESLYINSVLMEVFKQSQASEHTARKNAMEAATNNGKELLDKLDIEYNRRRQAKITQEISEIIGGAETLK